VVQTVLLYGAESWFLTTAMIQKLETFHHGCAHFITGQHIQENTDGSWMYPPSKKVLESAGLFSIQGIHLMLKKYYEICTYETNLSVMYNIESRS
jgi:hypothetical protein